MKPFNMMNKIEDFGDWLNDFLHEGWFGPWLTLGMLLAALSVILPTWMELLILFAGCGALGWADPGMNIYGRVYDLNDDGDDDAG